MTNLEPASKMKPLHGVICVLVLVIWDCRAESHSGFSCSTQLPVGRQAEEAESNDPASVPFVIRTTPKAGFKLDQPIRVELATKHGSDKTFSSFIMQAQVPSSNSQMGSFAPFSAGSKVVRCGDHAADTLVNSGPGELKSASADWLSPTDMDRTKTVEFDATVQTSDGKFWIIRSVLIRYRDDTVVVPPPTDVEGGNTRDPHDGETDAESGPPDDFEQPRTGNDGEGEDQGTGEDPNEAERVAEEERKESIRRDEEGEALDRAEAEEEKEDDHGREAEEKLYQEKLDYLRRIEDEENQAGEEAIEIELRHEKERHEKEMDDERAESERMKAEEKRERLERIRAEIRDKEEYEAMLREEEKNREENEKENEEDGEGEEIDKDDEPRGKDGGAVTVRSLGVLSAIILAVLVPYLV